MLPGIETLACQNLAVPMDIMQHVVNVESSRNPFAIGVVGGALARQPRNLDEALATASMLESKGYNFSVGLAQVNRHNLAKYGLDSYEKAFGQCDNLVAGSRILAECHSRSGGDWGKSFSCYYSGNFTTGFRHGYVQKVYNSIRRGQRIAANSRVAPIDVVSPRTAPAQPRPTRTAAESPSAPRNPEAHEQVAPEPVLLRPWSERHAPALPSRTQAPPEGTRPEVPAVSPDAAFVF